MKHLLCGDKRGAREGMRGGNNERGHKEEHDVVRGGQKMLVAMVGSTDRMTDDTVTSLTCIVCFEAFEDCFPDEFNPLKYFFFNHWDKMWYIFHHRCAFVHPWLISNLSHQHLHERLKQ